MRYVTFGALALALFVGCGNPLALPPAVISNRVDTLALFALSGTPVFLPSAYYMFLRQAVRTDQNTQFDFAFDIDTAGRAVLLPTGAMKLGNQSGIQISTMPFDSIRIAPGGKYQLDSAVVIDTGTVAVVHSRPTTCSFGLAGVYYAKLHVFKIDTMSTSSSARSVLFEILTNINCGYRGLEIGLPRH